ncbi:cation:dicarboxylase symporter family transporter [Micromonospora sp. STR1s_5]|nr:cation:dicarboxylase symporter family transporter [Micromonospora sp. STR1s_5]
MVKLAATMQSVRTLPISGLGLLIGVDRFMSEARALTNIIGNTVAVFVVAKWEGAFDREAFEACLAEQRGLRKLPPSDSELAAGLAPSIGERASSVKYPSGSSRTGG